MAMDSRRLALAGAMAAGIALIAAGLALTGGQDPPRGPAGERATRAAAPAPGGLTAIVGVRLFDGEKVLENATVVFRPGAIVAAGAGVPVPAGATIVEGRGRTLLPGLIDAHTHAYGEALERALAFGVTTELDMFSDHEYAARMRREQSADQASARADLYSAGTLATAPGGHGTEYGLRIPTLSSAAEAASFVDARIAEGSDYIKIVRDDGSSYGLHMPTLDPTIIAALVTAAHARGKLAVVHIGSYQDALDVLGAGADGLVHLFADRSPDDGFGRYVKSRNAFVVPTLSVLESTTGVASGVTLAGGTDFASRLNAAEKGGLQAAFPKHAGNTQDLANAERAVRLLKAAGVPLLAGSDAPNPGTAHGASLHRELELLVHAGLTPVEALVAATSAPAAAFGLADRGRIAPGLHADLLLVEGDPTRDILATRSIAAIYKNGIPFDREAAAPGAPAEIDAGDGLVSDFEETAPTSRFGAGWILSTDSIRGGGSTATMEIAAAGAGTSQGSLKISGRIAGGFAFPWAGVAFWPGSAAMGSVNLSRFKEVVFDARGDGGAYQLLAFAESLGPIPAGAPFTAGPAWAEQVIPFAAFRGIDGKDLQGLIFCAGAGRGDFSFSIDNVRFR